MSSDTAALTKSERLAELEAFWRLELKGLNGPTPPPISPLQPREPRGEEEDSFQELRLDAGVIQALQSVTQQGAVPVTAFVLGAWALLLACYSGEQDVIFGAAEHPSRMGRGDDSRLHRYAPVAPLRADVLANESCLPWLERLWRRYAVIREFSDVPCKTICSWTDFPAGQPLFETAVAISSESDDLSATHRERYALGQVLGEMGCPLILVEDLQSSGSLMIVYDEKRIGADAVIELLNRVALLLGEMSTDPSQRVGSLPLLTEEESRRLLVVWNQTETEYPRSRCIHHLIEEQAKRTPEAVAIAFRDEQRTYCELDSQASQLAERLQELGVGPETLVGIYMERSLEMMVALLATLKAGGAYVPLDPSYPQERISFMLEDAQVTVILTQSRLLASLPGRRGHAICLDSDWRVARPAKGWPAPAHVTSENLAYVIYTSGSTGKPKGVMVTHRNVVSFFAGMDQVMGSEIPGVWLAVSSISFDVSVLELFWTLARGFKVIIQEDQHTPDLKGPQSVPALLRRHNVSHLQCTPSRARVLSTDPMSLQALRSLRKLMLGGETLPGTLVEKLRQGVQAEIYNLYGPTEATIWSTTYRVSEVGNVIPIGRPIANTEVYILDRALRPVPVGVPGELWIGGAGVVRGYLNRPELNAEKFVRDPFKKGSGARLYRTGDMVRYRPDGNIEFIGRADSQVKIRGYRVELGEIEVILRQHPGVQDAVIAARDRTSGDRELVAYVVPGAGAGASQDQWRAYLRERLPGHMVPARFVLRQSLPLTPNGKIDRHALPAPEQNDCNSNSTATAPHSGLERRIAEIWKEALELEHIGRNDNFFDLGAHSLLVVEVNTRLGQMLHADLPLTTMFQYPTVSSLAMFLSGMLGSQSSQSHGFERGQARRESILRRTRVG